MDASIPVIAGTISTILFATSTMPMLAKAFRTKDLHSYSLGNILTANGGNLVHSLYVYSLPPGPIWWLHTFHVVTTGLMLAWYLRYERPFRLRFQRPWVIPAIRSLRVPVTEPVATPGSTGIPRPATPTGA
jgi:hypothetical protein